MVQAGKETGRGNKKVVPNSAQPLSGRGLDVAKYFRQRNTSSRSGAGTVPIRSLVAEEFIEDEMVRRIFPLEIYFRQCLRVAEAKVKSYFSDSTFILEIVDGAVAPLRSRPSQRSTTLW